jgi:hypothetical protein
LAKEWIQAWFIDGSSSRTKARESRLVCDTDDVVSHPCEGCGEHR